ncbi:hypothetical protein EYF80_035653 [Liparis tanakae]|uniref:Uncharacterized protein n=1 Tax=Liparis tanakae TaxID=230148 RepID=A0A4Z2GLJ4_9TELE|nr:hypothetical protein EYF80_035653 [Liparis tanakae]
MAHAHTPPERGLLGVQEQSPPHRSLLLVLITIQLHLHLENASVLLDKLTNTHQETGTLLFPLVTMQFFSSGLIMVLGPSESKSKAGRNGTSSPLADVDQSLPVLPSKGTADSHIWQRSNVRQAELQAHGPPLQVDIEPAHLLQAAVGAPDHEHGRSHQQVGHPGDEKGKSQTSFSSDTPPPDMG